MRLSRSRPVLAGAVVAAALLSAACGSTTVAPAAPSGGQAVATAEATADRLQPATVAVPEALRQNTFATERQVLIPPGWSISLYARVQSARLEAWTPDGKLLVSRPGDGAVDILTPNGGIDVKGAPATDATLVEGLDQPHGLAFDGSTLYIAESDEINAYDYANGSVANRRQVVTGLPDAKSPELGGAYAHALKSVAIGPDKSIYYSVGSSGNISADDRDATPQRAVIMRIPPGGGAPEVFARGVRNGTGLAVAPDGAVWTAVNNRDNIQYPFTTSFGEAAGNQQGKVLDGYVADHPAEELAKLTAGRDLGWPFCNPDPDVQPGVAGTAYNYTSPPFVRDQEMNADGSKLDCSTLKPIEQTFGAHSAPLGLTFANVPELGAGALVGIHGSWNRQPPRAPEVSFFPYSGGVMGSQQTLVGGFQSATGDRWGRPVAAVPGPDGAIYISDDTAAAVYRLAPPGK
jgi:glucose/arabinose dehydrogenase